MRKVFLLLLLLSLLLLLFTLWVVFYRPLGPIRLSSYYRISLQNLATNPSFVARGRF